MRILGADVEKEHIRLFKTMFHISHQKTEYLKIHNKGYVVSGSRFRSQDDALKVLYPLLLPNSIPPSVMN